MPDFFILKEMSFREAYLRKVDEHPPEMRIAKY
jgi:hypothetical protein